MPPEDMTSATTAMSYIDASELSGYSITRDGLRVDIPIDGFVNEDMIIPTSLYAATSIIQDSSYTIRIDGKRINISDFQYVSKDGRAIFKDAAACKAYDYAMEKREIDAALKKDSINRLKKILRNQKKATS